jgi:hypothetical protein
MLACPRCGNDAEYLPDEVFSLLRCEFCDDEIDAVDLLVQNAVDRAPATPRSRIRLSRLARSSCGC